MLIEIIYSSFSSSRTNLLIEEEMILESDTEKLGTVYTCVIMLISLWDTLGSENSIALVIFVYKYHPKG